MNYIWLNPYEIILIIYGQPICQPNNAKLYHISLYWITIICNNHQQTTSCISCMAYPFCSWGTSTRNNSWIRKMRRTGQELAPVGSWNHGAWWFGTCTKFSPRVGMMIQSDELIFFRGVETMKPSIFWANHGDLPENHGQHGFGKSSPIADICWLVTQFNLPRNVALKQSTEIAFTKPESVFLWQIRKFFVGFTQGLMVKNHQPWVLVKSCSSPICPCFPLCRPCAFPDAPNHWN